MAFNPHPLNCPKHWKPDAKRCLCGYDEKKTRSDYARIILTEEKADPDWFGRCVQIAMMFPDWHPRLPPISQALENEVNDQDRQAGEGE